VHQNTVGGYYVTPERWSHLAETFDRAAQSPDVRVVEFADLITRPDWVQRTLTDWLGWRIEGHFAKALQHIPKDFDTAALNGVRPLDPQTLTAWQRPEHQARLRNIEAALPHLPEWLHTHGYHA
jgi:hypothetical protein